MVLAGIAGPVETLTRGGLATLESQALDGTHGRPMAASTRVTGKTTRRMALVSTYTRIRVSTLGTTTMIGQMGWGCTSGQTGTFTKASGRMESGVESVCSSGPRTRQAMSESLRPIP